MAEENQKRKLVPYIVVFISFSLIVLLTVLLVDWLLLPALIHSSDTVTVPYVLGKTVPEAEKILSTTGLTVAKVSEQYSDQVPQGYIINQIPKAGQVVKSARSIYLTISKGQESVYVPYIVGQPSRSARILLKNKGLEIGNVEYATSETYGPDTIILQKTNSGMQVPFGTRIDLVVSRGGESQVKVPLVEGLKLDDAVKVLTESGLVSGVVTSVKNETYLPNTVLKQSPAAGETINKNSPVNLTITK